MDLECKKRMLEMGYRAAKARFDPYWHQEQASAAVTAKNWFAATFHFALLMTNDPDQASFYDGLQSSFQELKSQFEEKELDVDLYLAPVVKESLKLPRGNKLPEMDAAKAESINNGTWQRVCTPEAFEKTPLTELEVVRFRELTRQQPRDIYYNTLATAEYRMGNYQLAIDAALKSVELSPEAFPGDYAILAMSYADRGETEKANDNRKRFNETMKLDAFKDDEECTSFSAEVLRTFE